HWAEAVEEYRRALKLAPKDLSAKTYLAMALYKSGQSCEARGLYEELWKAQPSNLSTLQRLAEVQESLGDLEAAAASHRLLAEAHSRSLSYREALEAWRSAVRLKPLDPELWDALMEDAGRVGAVSEMMPGYLALARELAMGSRFQEALEVVERSQTLEPSNPALPPLLASIRRALEYSWRAAAQGENALPEDLARLIPLPFSEEAPEAPVATIELPGEPVEPVAEAADRATEPPVEATEPPVEQPEAPTAEIDSALRQSDEAWAGSLPDSASEDDEPSEPEPAEVVEPLSMVAESEPAVEIEPAGESEPATEAEPLESLDLSVGQYRDESVLLEVDMPPVVHHDEEEVPESPASGSQPAEDRGSWAGETPTLPGTLPDQEAQEALSEPSEEHLELLPPEGADSEDAAETPAAEATPADEVGEAAGESPPEEDYSGTAIAGQLAELADAHQQAGQPEQAAEAYGQALELCPDLPRALLGMARLHLASGQPELAEAEVRRALESPAPDRGEVGGPAAKLLLDILIGRAVGGDLEAVREGLEWLRSKVSSEGLPPSMLESGAAAFVELLGRCGAEHLEELALLSPEARGEVVLALRRAEELLAAGQIRSSTDEIHRLIAEHPDFLPAQSLLGRILVAQGRPEEARQRSSRLLELYQMRDTPDQALEVLGWRVAEGLGDGDDRVRLVELLRTQNRLSEAEAVSAGRLDGWRMLRRGDGETGRRGESRTQNPAPRTRNPLLGFQDWEELLELAQERLAYDDRDGAINLVREALEGSGRLDEATGAALLRVLQLMGADDSREELVEILRGLGLPVELAD
ncbi:MAG: tetratricopeptide repeat protein, partial [Chloroflexota bacterium]